MVDSALQQLHFDENELIIETFEFFQEAVDEREDGELDGVAAWNQTDARAAVVVVAAAVGRSSSRNVNSYQAEVVRYLEEALRVQLAQ